jgi:hypothetical protein
LQATITVSGGAVTAISLSAAQQTTLEEYSIGDVLTANNADLGGSGSGLLIPITGDGDGQIVVVAAGVYQEVAPIQIKRRNVSIIGQALRSCIVHPTQATETNNLFELNSGSYLSSLTFTGIKAGTGTGNTLDAVLPTTQGWNAAFYSGAFITKSPYIQNCTNFSDSEIDNTNLNAHNPAGGAAGDIDSAPTGGGLLVNGATPATSSPLRSMVCDSYTHVALNGPGILVTNNGYCQATSSYAFFNRYHIKALNGGQANLAASTTDFGNQALVADGRSTTAIFTAALSTAAGNGDITFTIDAPTADASWHGTATRPQPNMLVELNSITYPVLSAVANGSGWDVTISRPDPANKFSNLGLNGAVSDDAAVSFFLRSMIASSGHTMEYVGSGTNYSALPENGGVPDDTTQIVELNNGKIWTATTDHNGKFTVGPLEVDQRTGAISFEAGATVTSIVNDSTPQLGGDLDANGNSIILAAGTEAEPLLRITGDADTGVFSPGADQIAISTGGTGRLFIDSSGNVGIGVSSPSVPLHVSSSVQTQIFAQSSSTASNILFSDTNTTDSITIGCAGNELRFRTDLGAYTFRTNNNAGEACRIDSSGRLLFGTTTHIGVSADSREPIQCVENSGSRIILGRNNSTVAVNSSIGGVQFYGNADGTYENIAQIFCSGDGTHAAGDKPTNLSFWTTPSGSSSASERMRIDNSGNVGIGTTNPPNRLSVLQGEKINFCAGSNGAAYGYITGDSSNNLAFGYGTTETARIDSSGRLLVGTNSSFTNFRQGFIQANGTGAGAFISATRFGTTSGGGELTLGASKGSLGTHGVVSDGFQLGLISFVGSDGADGISATSIRTEVDGTPGTNNMPGRLVFSTNSGAASPTERMRIDSSGNVGLGTGIPSNTAGFSRQLEVAGTRPCLTLNSTSAVTRNYSVGVNGSGSLLFWDNTASASRMAINSSGNVGIGTASPASLLHLESSSPVIQLEDTDAGGAYSQINGNGTGGRILLSADAGNTGSNSTIEFAVDGTERVRIDSSGRLGIGTASVLSDFHIASSSPTIRLEDDDVASQASYALIKSSSDGGLQFYADPSNARSSTAITFNVDGGEKVRIDSSGFVGIGNTSPDDYLVLGDTSTSGDIGLRFKGNASSRQFIMFGDPGGAQVGDIMYDHGTNAMRFRVNNSTAATINSSGNLGVGNTAPVYRLDCLAAAGVQNILRSGQTGVSNGYVISSNGTALTYSWNTTNSETMRLDSSGKLLVGTNSAVETSATSVIQAVSSLGGYYIAARNDIGVTVNNALGGMRFYGNDSDGNYDECARIECAAEASHTSSSKPSRLAFYTTASGASTTTERMRITSDAYVRLASGTGGIQFNGDTAAANALDDYEEGTWTPAPAFGGTTTSVAGTFQGNYTKIGRLVTVFCSLQFTNNGTGSGANTIGGLPFEVADTFTNTTAEFSGSVGFFANGGDRERATYGVLALSGTNDAQLIGGSNVNHADLDVVLDEATIVNNSSIRFTLQYLTTA